MKPSKWDTYFQSHYQPVEREWGEKDLAKYKNWYNSWLPFIEKSGNFNNGDIDIFEIGSGVGAFVALLAERGYKITGSDISELMVHVGRKVFPQAQFLYCDIEKGIPGHKRFSHVLAFEVLEHLKNPGLAMRNIHRSLQKGGYFIGTTPYPFPKNFKDPTHINVHYPEYWERLFFENGFLEVKMRPMSFFPAIWRVSKYFNFPLPWYIPFPYFVSTTLIAAKT